MNAGALQNYFLLALILAAAVLSLFIFQPFLSPLVLGIVFAVALYPLYARILRFFGGRQTLAALATVALVSVVVIIVIAFLGAQVLDDAQHLYASLTSGQGAAQLTASAHDLSPAIDRYLPGAGEKLVEFTASINEYARLALTWLIQNLASAFTGVSAFFVDLFIFFFTLFYILRDGLRLKDYMVKVSPLADRDDLRIFARLDAAVNSVVKGKLMIALIQGVLTGIGFVTFGVPNAIFWGVVAAIASLLPPFGTALVVLPAVAYLLIVGHMGMAIGLTIWGVIAVGLIDNMLSPRLMSSGTQLHPLLVLLSVLGGLAFFGPVGIFLGPLTISLLLMLLSLYGELSAR